MMTGTQQMIGTNEAWLASISSAKLKIATWQEEPGNSGRERMSSISLSAIVFACTFGGAMLGMFLNKTLPEHHLNAESKSTVNLGIGLIGTMAALVLALVVSEERAGTIGKIMDRIARESPFVTSTPPARLMV